MNLPLEELTPPDSTEPLADRVQPSVCAESLSDDVVINHWLAPIRFRSENTARSYLVEVNRFRIFLACMHPDSSVNSLLQNASEMDAMLYECILGDQIAPNGDRMSLLVPDWILSHFGRKGQPFQIKPVTLKIGATPIREQNPRLLKESSVNQAMRILHGLYAYLSRPSTAWSFAYVPANPITRVKKSKSRVIEQTQRYVPVEAIKAMRTFVEETAKRLSDLPESDPEKCQLAQYQRMRWLFALLFGLWARRSEIASLKMSDFTHSYKGWFVQLHRKGGSTDRIPAPQWLIDELMLYRKSQGMTPLPLETDSHAAVMRLKSHKGITAQSIYLEVKEMAVKTANEIQNSRLLPEIADDMRNKYVSDLRRFSPHWFRHSAASMAINTNAMSLQIASVRLAHKSTNTTSQMYFHADQEQERHGIESMGDAIFGPELASQAPVTP